MITEGQFSFMKGYCKEGFDFSQFLSRNFPQERIIVIKRYGSEKILDAYFEGEAVNKEWVSSKEFYSVECSIENLSKFKFFDESAGSFVGKKEVVDIFGILERKVLGNFGIIN